MPSTTQWIRRIAAVAALVAGVIPATAGAAGAAVTRPGPGYWLVSGDGGVFAFGRGAYEGGLARTAIGDPVVGAATTPDGQGYWLADAAGGVFSFGDARFHGSVPSLDGRPTPARVVAIAATPTGGGYWLAGADGSVFAFGDAHYLGGIRGAAPVVGIAATPTGKGYWLVAADGSVYTFGDARFYGRADIPVPVVGLAPTADGGGYWLASRAGGVYSFGDAAFAGALTTAPLAPIVGIAAVPHGTGYWLAGADGGVFTFGAGYYGGLGVSRLNRPIVAIVSGPGVTIPQTPTAPTSPMGFDVSWPQCGRVRPAPPYAFGIVGATSGHLFSVNPCLADQWQWAQSNGSFAGVYVNSDAPTLVQLAQLVLSNSQHCGLSVGCILYRWGQQGAAEALATSRAIRAPMWWVDVETGNAWLPDQTANADVLAGMIAELRGAGKQVGIYSTSHQWGVIAGAYAPGLPLWVPGAPSANPASYCNGQSFGGGTPWMTQTGDGTFDVDVLCAAGLGAYRQVFAPPAPIPVPEFPPAAVIKPVATPPAPTPTPSTVAPRAAPVPTTAAPAPLPPPRTVAAAPLRHRGDSYTWLIVWSFVAVTGAVAWQFRRRRPRTLD